MYSHLEPQHKIKYRISLFGSHINPPQGQFQKGSSNPTDSLNEQLQAVSTRKSGKIFDKSLPQSPIEPIHMHVVLVILVSLDETESREVEEHPCPIPAPFPQRFERSQKLSNRVDI